MSAPILKRSKIGGEPIGPLSWDPDSALAPGETIKESLDERHMTQRDLGELLGVHTSQINRLIHGRQLLTAELAVRLEYIFGMSARFWMNLETQYRLFLARKALKGKLKGPRGTRPT